MTKFIIYLIGCILCFYSNKRFTKSVGEWDIDAVVFSLFMATTSYAGFIGVNVIMLYGKYLHYRVETFFNNIKTPK